MRPGYPARSCRSFSPGRTGLEGSHDWLSRAMEVFGCVFMGGSAATPGAAALQAQEEANQSLPIFKTLFTAFRSTGSYGSNLVQMRTPWLHGFLPFSASLNNGGQR